MIPRAPPVTTSTSLVVSGSSHFIWFKLERAQNRLPSSTVGTVARFRIAACGERLCEHPRGCVWVFRRRLDHARVEVLRFEMQRAREARRTAHKHETEIIAAFHRLARAVQQQVDVTLVRVGRQENDDASTCARVRERSFDSDFERMVWRGKYAPVSCFVQTLSLWQSAFDEFARKTL